MNFADAVPWIVGSIAIAGLISCIMMFVYDETETDRIIVRRPKPSPQIITPEPDNDVLILDDNDFYSPDLE